MMKYPAAIWDMIHVSVYGLSCALSYALNASMHIVERRLAGLICR